MPASDELLAIIERILSHRHTVDDLAVLREMVNSGGHQESIQLGKYNNYIDHGEDVHIGDRIYYGGDAQAIREIVRSLLQELQIPIPRVSTSPKSVDEIVQQVRSRLHDDIQRLHGTMPLVGVSYWVDLGELFMDVNILKEVSSNRKSELNDLWQDFTDGVEEYSSNRSLDRIGLGSHDKRVSGLEVLGENKNLIVLGKPGSGKTTYLQRIVTDCNQGKLQPHRIPVLIKLRDFRDDGRKVEYDLQRYLTQEWQLDEVETKFVLSQGRALILLDGLDEVIGSDGQEISKKIKLFARKYPQNQLIVTCRTQSQESIFERFDYVEIADFNKAQIKAFVEHWFKAVCSGVEKGQAKAKQFLEKLYLSENKPIRELANTPILLSLTCAVFQTHSKFYSKRSKLHEEGLELLLDAWDKSREIEREEIYRDLSVERKQELLSYLAMKKFEQQQYILFEQEEIERYIAEFLDISLRDSRQVLKAIEAQHGLLIERAQKVWSFSHLTFQEYLVAKWFCVHGDFDTLVLNITKKHWQEIFLLSTNLSQEVKQLFKSMIMYINECLKNNCIINELLVLINDLEMCNDISLKNTAKKGLLLDLIVNDLNKESFSHQSDNHLFTKLDNDFKKEYTAFYIIVSDFFSRHDKLMVSFILLLIINRVLNGYFDSNLSNILLPNKDYKPEDELGGGFVPTATGRHWRIITTNSYLNYFNIMNILPPFDYYVASDLGGYAHGTWQYLDAWWGANHQDWESQFKTVLQAYRDFCKISKLNQTQQDLLQKYYYAVNLMIDCLNSDCMMSENLRQEIEDALFLPVTEIEKKR